MDTSNLQDTLKEIEDSIAENKLAVQRGEDLKSLKLDRRFQSVFIEGYIGTESKKLFDILTDPSGVSPYSTEKIHLMLEAISHFRSFVGTEDFQGTVEQDAMYGAQAIGDDRELRKTITAENAEDEDN